MTGNSATGKSAPRLTGDDVSSNLKALIVDDEADICYLLRNILRHKNIDASIVTSLAEATNHLQKNDPPIIFLDNQLSDGLGVEHIHKFKKEHPHSYIVMITAHDSSANRERAYREGADFFIGKPFSRDAILETLEKIDRH